MRYRVDVTRDTTETAYMFVDAESLEEAENLALGFATKNVYGTDLGKIEWIAADSPGELYVSDSRALEDGEDEEDTPEGHAARIAAFERIANRTRI